MHLNSPSLIMEFISIVKAGDTHSYLPTIQICITLNYIERKSESSVCIGWPFQPLPSTLFPLLHPIIQTWFYLV